MIRYIGIDLGQKGAITVQSKLPGSKPYWAIYPFFRRHNDETKQRTILEDEMLGLISDLCSKSECFVTIERPMLFSKGTKAIASLHENFGLIKGMLHAKGVTSFWYPTPVQWKKLANAPGNDKDKMLVLASRVTKAPNLSPVTADSVLICEACRLHFK